MRPRHAHIALCTIPALVVGLVVATRQSPTLVSDTDLTSVSQSGNDSGAPTWLPSAARPKSETGEPKAPSAVFRQYSLSGSANENTLTPEGIAASASWAHPETEISVSFVPHLVPEPLPTDPRWFVTTPVDVNGAMGTVTYAKNGLGATRVDWVDAVGNYHVVLEDRLRTPDGVSGVDVDTLLRIARSIET
jgi:hypothetical protein